MDAHESIDRRAFHQLTTAAFLGAAAGLTETAAVAAEPKPATKPLKPADRGNPLLLEPNICRGLNTCKGKGRGDGRGGANQCVGTSTCALVATHICAGNNECRGQGACDVGDPAIYQINYPGENTCRGKGACGVPITADKDHIWRQARRRFEALMADIGGRAGTAPPRT